MMRRVEDFRYALQELFHSAGNDRDVREALETDTILKNLDYYSLLQALHHNAGKVYEYQAYGSLPVSFDYRGQELFLTEATKLYENIRQATCGTTLKTLTYELWYLPDNSFAVTSCFRVKIANGAYTTEYRIHKGSDWTETDMAIDFYALALRLRDMSKPVLAHEYPIYDL